MNNSTATVSNTKTNVELSDCGNWRLEDGKLYSKYFLTVERDISREVIDSIHPCAEAVVGWYKETLNVLHDNLFNALEELDNKPDSYFITLEQVAEKLDVIEVMG